MMNTGKAARGKEGKGGNEKEKAKASLSPAKSNHTNKAKIGNVDASGAPLAQERDGRGMVDIVECLALHLACSTKFQKLANISLGMVEKITPRNTWLCSLGVSGNQQEKDAWLENFHSNGYSMATVTRAVEIYKSCYMPRELTPVINPTPSWTQEAISFREDLFRYFQHRRELLQIQKESELGQYNLLMCYPHLATNNNPQDQERLKELFQLQQVSGACRSNLLETELERVVIQVVDGLLLKFKQNFKGTSDIWATNDLRDSSIMVTNLIIDSYKFTPSHTNNPFNSQRKTPRPQASLVIRNGSVRQNMLLHGNLSSHDKTLTEKAGRIFAEIDESDFNQRLGQIMSIRTRLQAVTDLVGRPNCARKYNSSGSYERLDSSHVKKMDLLHDNLFHARALFQNILDDLPSDLSMTGVHESWERLMAIVALCWGCSSEPALFLSTMDVLLDQLRTCIGCHSSIFGETGLISPVRVVKKKLLDPDDEQEQFLLERSPPNQKMEPVAAHKLHLRFTELSLFIRGCVVQSLHFTKFYFSEPQERDGKLLQVRSLLSWDDVCIVCDGQIHPKEVNRRRDLVSVAIRDGRVGDRFERSEISTNRRDVYDCLQRFLSPSHWYGDALGPFFFYFAAFTHTECKAMRGKTGS